MECVPEDEILRFNSDALEKVRAKYELSAPGRMKEAVQILQDWIHQQPHFRKKDFPQQYLETCLIGRKGSIERTKVLLDKLCTLRTLLPQYFGVYNAGCDFDNLFDLMSSAMMPRQTEDNYRIYLLKVHGQNFTPKNYIDFYRHAVLVCDYMKSHDYSDGIIDIVDLSEVNVLELSFTVDLVVTRHAATIMLEGYGMRLKTLHFITNSAWINSLMNILKMCVSSKVASRFFVHKTKEELYEYMDRKLLPRDYGGEEPSLREQHDQFIHVLSSEKNLKHLREMNSATVDESCRRADSFNEQYAGTPGTFRVLTVD